MLKGHFLTLPTLVRADTTIHGMYIDDAIVESVDRQSHEIMLWARILMPHCSNAQKPLNVVPVNQDFSDAI